MASRLLFNPLRTPLLTASLGLGATSLLLLQPHTLPRPVLLDSSPSPLSPKDWSFTQYQHDARTPIITKSGGLNARAVRQMSAGSIIGTSPPHLPRGRAMLMVVGLIAGLGLSLFSKPLALLLGLAIVGLQTAEKYGIHLVPYGYLQRYAKSVDLRSAVQDNAAFKISFGMMFALSAFAEL